jgi:O-antigen ligase
MLSSHRSWASCAPALLRLLLVFVALCLVFAQIDLAQRHLRDQTTGLPSPFWAHHPLPPPNPQPFLGINVELTALAKAGANVAMEELAAAGFGWVRIRLAWDQIEPAPGDYQWQDVDRALAALSEAKLVPILLLDGSPVWARAPNDRTSIVGALAPPEEPISFARFAKAVATRYGDQVHTYQIWDEPNIAPHWGESHIEPVSYARLLKAAAPAIREADPDAQILLAALAPTADRGHLAQDELYFLNRLYAAGAAPYFDGVAIQPFGFATRADDPRIDRRVLNLRRTLWIRQTMLDANDGDTPIWLIRYGWNRLPGSTWKSVSAEQQRTFAIAALEMAYHEWPWVVAMGWPAAAPPPTDPTAGFALTPELAEAFHTASTALFTQPRPRSVSTPALALWMPIILWWLAVTVLLWRGWAAARKLPWGQWRAQWLHRPVWQQGGSWALLLLVYYQAVWPPLILLCWVVAALGFTAQPRLGLALTLMLLPFYDDHKELVWLDQRWTIPPAHAALLCLLPAAWLHRPKSLPRDRWLAVAVGWVLVMALSAVGVWYWPAYWRGMIDLVMVPILLFLLIRAWATTRHHIHILVVTLAAGGLLLTAFGLIDWMKGGGTAVDGLRRLTGPTFSSNHTALYLIRTLAITIGLTLMTRGRARWRWSVGTVATAIALFLTGSRGAVLLGLPAGALFLLSHHKIQLPSRRVLAGWLAVGGIGLAFVAWTWRARLMNIATLMARVDGWLPSFALWFDHFLFGVGPDGFWWSLPAYLSLTSNADPNLRHPHLLWLEIATSGGLLALVWLLAVGLLVYRWTQQKRRRLTWLQVGLLTGLIAALAHAQMDAFQALPPLAGWNWAALALLIANEYAPFEHEQT